MSNEQKFYNYFTGVMKLNCAAACGILANIKYESNFKTTIKGDNGTSYGICQWHNARFTNLKNYCTKNELDYKSIEGQLHYLEYELTKSYKSVLNYLKKVSNDSTGSYNAGYKFCYSFERPAKKSESSVKRGNYAKTYFKKYYKAPDPTPTPSPVVKTYTVKTGDTLSSIAKTYKTTWKKLYELNKELIDSTAKKHGKKKDFYNYLYPGEKLRLN